MSRHLGGGPVMTSAMCRGARGKLRLSQNRLAGLVGVSRTTLRAFEADARGSSAIVRTCIKQALRRVASSSSRTECALKVTVPAPSSKVID